MHRNRTLHDITIESERRHETQVYKIKWLKVKNGMKQNLVNPEEKKKWNSGSSYSELLNAIHKKMYVKQVTDVKECKMLLLLDIIIAIRFVAFPVQFCGHLRNEFKQNSIHFVKKLNLRTYNRTCVYVCVALRKLGDMHYVYLRVRVWWRESLRAFSSNYFGSSSIQFNLQSCIFTKETSLGLGCLAFTQSPLFHPPRWPHPGQGLKISGK